LDSSDSGERRPKFPVEKKYPILPQQEKTSEVKKPEQPLVVAKAKSQ